MLKSIKDRKTPLQLFKEKWENCTACDLHHCRHDKAVLCRGTYPCDVLFVGEAPGKSEDTLGIPFYGPAGQLLDKIVLSSVPSNITCAFTNLVCCIPLDEDGIKTVSPDDEYVEACSCRLQEFIELCNPKLIVCVGKVPHDWLDIGYKKSLNHLRIPVVMIRHPSAILQSNDAVKGSMVNKNIVAIRDAVEKYVIGDEK